MGASGYTGAELIKILNAHPYLDLKTCYVSANSRYSGQSLGQVHSSLAHIKHINMQPLNDEQVAKAGADHDLIFMALPHEVSHHWVNTLSKTKAVVFDLSGAFRLSSKDIFASHYGFSHDYPALLSDRVYGLAEWYREEISKAGTLIAVPGCYPTASLLALKPLVENSLLKSTSTPIINAVSGVSGAGRKASETTSFYEVSLQAYGVLSHRHTPEIEEFAKSEVIFTPHLGAYKRGILATVTAFVNEDIKQSDIDSAFQAAYGDKPLVRICDTWPKVDQVAHTPFCDIHWAFDANKRCVVVSSAIDNLLKGAASQAVQCANIRFNFDETAGLIAS